MPVFHEHDLEEPWWTKEPAPKPGEGRKLVSRGRELLVMIEDRRYRVRGLASIISPQHLQLHLWLWLSEARQYYDAVELYDHEQRRDFIAGAATECELDASLIERDVGVIVHECERMRDAMLKDFAEQKDRNGATLQ